MTSRRDGPNSQQPAGSKWPTCPYCGAFIPRSRRRATTCRSCGETYYVRGTQTLFKTRALRREQVAFVELVKSISALGVDTRAVAAATNPSMNADELLTLILEACDRVADQVAEHAHSIYYAIGRFLFASGKDPRRALKLAGTAELKAIREQGATHVLLLRAPDSDHCETCRQADGRRVRLDEAESGMPIPCPECITRKADGSWSWCSCRYAMAPAIVRRSAPPPDVQGGAVG